MDVGDLPRSMVSKVLLRFRRKSFYPCFVDDIVFRRTCAHYESVFVIIDQFLRISPHCAAMTQDDRSGAEERALFDGMLEAMIVATLPATV